MGHLLSHRYEPNVPLSPPGRESYASQSFCGPGPKTKHTGYTATNHGSQPSQPTLVIIRNVICSDELTIPERKLLAIASSQSSGSCPKPWLFGSIEALPIKSGPIMLEAHKVHQLHGAGPYTTSPAKDSPYLASSVSLALRLSWLPVIGW